MPFIIITINAKKLYQLIGFRILLPFLDPCAKVGGSDNFVTTIEHSEVHVVDRFFVLHYVKIC